MSYEEVRKNRRGLRLDIETQPLDVAAAIDGLRGDYSKLGTRLRVLSHGVKCTLSGLTIRVHYPAFRSGKPTDDDLTDLIAHYISHFALPRSVRNRAYKKFPKLTPEEIELHCSELRAKAVRTFIKAQKATKRNGEAGELMLFLLTEWILGAPQILAKMSLKTNPNVPVLGSDGVHIKFDSSSQKLKFYFGEAKIHSSLTAGISSAAKSIKKALSSEEVKFELELIEKNVELTGLDEAAREALLSYLDPWEEDSNLRLQVVTSLIAFDYDAYSNLKEVDHDKRTSEFITALTDEVTKIAPKVSKALSAVGLEAEEIELFLLPLPSVSVLREKFQSLIGWAK